MLFFRTIASASILAVGSASSSSLARTAVDSIEPKNKPDGRVIFGKITQRRSLSQDHDIETYHRKVQSNLTLSDLIRCNHDDPDDPCGEPELTTIIIGGGGTLPPKPVSNENSNAAPSPVNSPHSNVETPTHSTVNSPSPITHEHTPTTNVGNGPTYAPTDAIIFEGETDVPIPGSNTSPPSSPSSNFLNPIPPLPTTQTTYPPTGDILFEGEIPTSTPLASASSNPPSSLLTRIVPPTYAPTEGIMFEGQIPTSVPIPGATLNPPPNLAPPPNTPTQTPPTPFHWGSSNTKYPTTQIILTPVPTSPDTIISTGEGDGPPIKLDTPTNYPTSLEVTASPTEGDVPTLTSTTERPWSGNEESTDSSWVSQPTTTENSNGSGVTTVVKSSKSGKEESTVLNDSSWESPPAASSSGNESNLSTAVSSSKSGKEESSVSWLQTSPVVYSGKSDKNTSPSSSIESSSGTDSPENVDTAPEAYGSKSGKEDYSESTLESPTVTSDWSSPAVYSSKSEKFDSILANSSGKSGKEGSNSGPSSAEDDSDVTFDSKAEKVESSAAIDDESSWSAAATYSSKSDKEGSSPVESSPSNPGVSSSKSGKEYMPLSSAVESSKSGKEYSPLSSSSAVDSSKSSKEESILSADSSWVSPPTSAGNDNGSDWSPVVYSSKSGKEDSTVNADSSWVSPPTNSNTGDGSDWSPLDYSSKSEKVQSMLAVGKSKSSKTLFKNGKSGKALANGAVVPEFITDNRNLPVANDDFFTTNQGESISLDILANDSVPSGCQGTFETPSNGVLDKDGPELLYSPNDGFCGVDTFKYTLSHQQLSDTALVTIDVVCDDGSNGLGPPTTFEPEEMLNPDRPSGEEGVGTPTSFEPDEMLNPDRPSGEEGVGTPTSFEPEEMLNPDRPSGDEDVGTPTSFEPDEMLNPDRPSGDEGVGTPTSFEPEEMLNPDRPSGEEGVGTPTSFEPEEMLNPDRPSGGNGSGGDNGVGPPLSFEPEEIIDSLRLEDDFAEGIMNEEIAIPVLANDTIPCEADGVFGTPEHGKILETTEDGFIYKPDTDFCGYDKFEYEISSGDYFDSATVTVHILCDTKPAAIVEPSAVNDEVTIKQDSGLVVYKVLENDNGGEGCDGLVVESILYNANHGSCAIQDGVAVTYEPNSGYHGQDNCVYKACNQYDNCDSAVLTITVTESTIGDIIKESIEEQRTSLSSTTTMNEPVLVETLSSDVKITSHGDHGTCSVKDTSYIMFTPDPGFAGYDVCGFSSCDSPSICTPDALAIIVTPDALAIERKTTVESSISIPLEEFFNLSFTEVVIDYNPTDGVLDTGDGKELTYNPNPGFIGTEVLEYSLCTLVEPVLCDKATITFIVGIADATEGDGTKETVTISENSSQEKNSNLMISIGAAIGAFIVLGATAVYRKRSSATDYNDDGFKGIPADVVTGASTPTEKRHPHGSSLEHAYAECNNISVSSFLTGESTSPYGPKSKRSLLKKSNKHSSASSLFSHGSIKSKKSAVVEDVVDL